MIGIFKAEAPRVSNIQQRAFSTFQPLNTSPQCAAIMALIRSRIRF